MLIAAHVGYILEGVVTDATSRVDVHLNADPARHGWFTLSVNGKASRDFLPAQGHYALILQGVIARLRDTGAFVVVRVDAARTVRADRTADTQSVGDTLALTRTSTGAAS